jgi:glyoxylase-like metal-dependent hydrolase (beta-lactamase superfamily II)
MPSSRYFAVGLVLILVGVGSIAVAADVEQGFTAIPIAQGVSMLQGYECNIAASAGEDGVVLVDTCGVQVAEQLLATVKQLYKKSIRFTINTHVHGDHTGGDAALQKLAPVIAHHNTRKWMMTGNEVTRDKPSPSEALPIVTFEGELTLHLNGEDIRLLSLPPAHTDSDVVVMFTKANVVCLGDVYMSPGVSFADRWYGGSTLGLIKALEFVLPQIPADAKVIPGHGVVSSREDVAAGLEVLKQMEAAVESGIRAGKTLEQLTAERPFDKWRGSIPQWSASDKSLDGWVRDFYRELAGMAMTKPN